jgi:hypothetical protein
MAIPKSENRILDDICEEPEVKRVFGIAPKSTFVIELEVPGIALL